MNICFEHQLLEALVKAGVKSPIFKSEKGYYRSKNIDSRIGSVALWILVCVVDEGRDGP